MVFKGRREGSVITRGGGRRVMPLDFGGSHGFQGETEGEISHHGGGLGLWRNHLVFKGGRGGSVTTNRD